MNELKSFLGTGWSFPPSFSKVTKDVVMISDEEDIRNSLEILLTTLPGERIMQPDYGCDLSCLLFEPIDTSMKTYIKDLITTSILYFEPRIKPGKVELIPDPEAGCIVIDIDYTIRTTNSRANYVYKFYKTEGINL